MRIHNLKHDDKVRIVSIDPAGQVNGVQVGDIFLVHEQDREGVFLYRKKFGDDGIYIWDDSTTDKIELLCNSGTVMDILNRV